jgi:hypothetical protein
MLTGDEITKAVNDAGYTSVEELTRSLKLAKLVVEKQDLAFRVEGKRAARDAASQATEAEIQSLQADIAAKDAAIIGLVQA